MSKKRVGLFKSSQLLPSPSDPSYTGRGFMPDLFSDGSRMATLAHASRTTLENSFVPGAEGNMPPPSSYDLRAVQPGQGADTGSGGAGSFASSFAQR